MTMVTISNKPMMVRLVGFQSSIHKYFLRIHILIPSKPIYFLCVEQWKIVDFIKLLFCSLFTMYFKQTCYVCDILSVTDPEHTLFDKKQTFKSNKLVLCINFIITPGWILYLSTLMAKCLHLEVLKFCHKLSSSFPSSKMDKCWLKSLFTHQPWNFFWSQKTLI